VPKATSLTTLKAGKGQLTVKWKKQSTQTSGYQIQYSTNKNFKGAKTVNVKSTKKTIKKLKKKKKYYVRVRAYKKVGGKGKYYYSPWTTKTVKSK
jgi:6-phosphogluconate dehydrogenase (decarboxylating)